MKRYKHSLSNYKLLTCDMGQLVPCNLAEVLPGDTFRCNSSALIRLSPMEAPVMHPVHVRLHHWFVPTRLLWDSWESFITGGVDGEGDGAGSPPTLTVNTGTGYDEGSLPDYLGIPTGVDDITHSALPIRVYNKIYNEFYRDQDMVSAVSEDSTDIQLCAWEKDYFTTARDLAQRGPEVTLPLGTTAPIVGLGAQTTATPTGPGAGNRVETGGATEAYDYLLNSNSASPNNFAIETDSSGEPLVFANLSNATGVSIPEVREYFALQRYAEARARFGTRYTEWLRYYGIRPSDARLQRPEYIGGGKSVINFSEVLQTSNDGTNGNVGDLYGHGIAAVRTRPYYKFIEEHGYIMTLMSVRPRSMYSDGLNRLWSRTTKEDYWTKELQFIGQQEILNKEVYADPSDGQDDNVFGYQDKYMEYRYIPNTIAGQFRTTFNDWHFGRIFGARPTLNQSFTDCNPAKRPFSVQSEDVLWCMVSNKLRARRMVTSRPSPKVF